MFRYVCKRATKEKKIGLSMTSLSILGIERILQLERCYNCFQQPRASLCHKEAVEKIVTLPATTRDVGELLSGMHAQ